MWGKRQTTGATGSEQYAKPAEYPRALSTAGELCRSADWERMSDTDRAALRSVFAPFPESDRTSSEGSVSTGMSSAIQQWVAALVAPGFQTDAAQLIRVWLDETAPDVHLFIGGSSGQGRRSLATALARQAMTKQPIPPDFCYVPVPSALDRAYLLALPNGTGDAFTKTLDQALRILSGGWNSAPAPTDSATPPAPSEETQQTPSPKRARGISQAFAPLEQPAFASAGAYVEQLRATFDALAASDADLPVSYDEMPTWLVRAPSGDSASAVDHSPVPSAPVVNGTLIRDKLDDLLIRANGGVLVLPAADLLVVDGSWLALSAALTSRTLQVKASWPLLPLTARVILVGDSSAYNGLASAPGDFNRLFRYETWCASATTWSPNTEAAYATLADGVAQRHHLPAFDPSAVARLIEEGARRGNGLNRTYLTTDLVLLHDLAHEAGRTARAREAITTSGSDVATALQRRRTLQRANARRVHEAILSGQAITPTSGAAIGQINGLGIYEYHPPEGAFSVPIRISATVSPGRDERVLDIEREADQVDADHVRGEMTIEGYLAHRFGQRHPINLVGRIRFEQEHGTTGGDSASGAILFALLSALAQAPIRLSYAVTGAVGQYGEMQPIGGVNTKIEGFWELCQLRRAHGELAEGGYGVLIPAVNARDLMLRDEVAEAIATEGWFHVWPINTVDEALTILTGFSTTEITSRVEARLLRFHEIGTLGRATR